MKKSIAAASAVVATVILATAADAITYGQPDGELFVEGRELGRRAAAR